MKKIISGIIVSLTLSVILNAAANKIYVVVNGDNVTSQDIVVALKDPKVKFDTLPLKTQQNILAKLVEQKLLSQNALKTNIVKDPVYKDTLKSLTQNLAFQVWLQQKAAKITVPVKTLKEFYEKNKAKFTQPEQFHARHILVKTKKEAQEIIQILNKNKSNLKEKFISLAKEKSTGPSGKNGGDLGFFTITAMVPAFSKATAALKVGEVTQEPVKTQFGFHVIYLEDKKNKSIATFEQVRRNILQQLGQELLMKNVQQIANSLKKDAKIEYK